MSEKATVMTGEEIREKVRYNPSELIWHNFSQIQPDPDKWILIWCNMGKLAPNLILTYRDAFGNYELPNPNKRYPALAWAYVENPRVNLQHLKELEKEAAKNPLPKSEKDCKSKGQDLA